MTRATHDRTRDHRGTEKTEVLTLTNPIGPIAAGGSLDSLLIQLAANRAQQPSNEDTSGATLGQLETEVNELKAILRAAGIIGGAPRVYAPGAGTGAAYNAATKNAAPLAEAALGSGLAGEADISIPALGSGAAYDADPAMPEGYALSDTTAGTGSASDATVGLGVNAELTALTGTSSDATVTIS